MMRAAGDPSWNTSPAVQIGLTATPKRQNTILSLLGRQYISIH